MAALPLPSARRTAQGVARPSADNTDHADAQAEEIKNRLGKLLALFHPFSDPYTDVLAVLRCLRGTHPLRGMPEPGFRQVMEGHRP